MGEDVEVRVEAEVREEVEGYVDVKFDGDSGFDFGSLRKMYNFN